MTLNELIAKIDIAPGAKTTVVAAALLIASAVKWLEPLGVDPALVDWVINNLIIPALAITLGLKIVRSESSPLVTSGGLAAAAAAAAGLFLSGCLLSIGPEGRYLQAELDPGVCLAANAGEYLSAGLGFCTEEGASTDSLEGADPPDEPDEPSPE